MSRLLDRVGKIYYPWEVISFHGRAIKSSKSTSLWLCKCISCNSKKIIEASRFYPSPVCMCKINKKQKKCIHGMSRSPEYKIWGGIKARCLNSNQSMYRLYGAIGITVCDEWLKFENFYRDMGDKPSPIHSIDRVDGAKGYCKDNCRWATPVMQANNRKTNRALTYKGVTMNISQWARKMKISKNCLKYRIDSGWPISKALNKPSIRGEIKPTKDKPRLDNESLL